LVKKTIVFDDAFRVFQEKQNQDKQNYVKPDILADILVGYKGRKGEDVLMSMVNKTPALAKATLTYLTDIADMNSHELSDKLRAKDLACLTPTSDVATVVGDAIKKDPSISGGKLLDLVKATGGVDEKTNLSALVPLLFEEMLHRLLGLREGDAKAAGSAGQLDTAILDDFAPLLIRTLSEQPAAEVKAIYIVQNKVDPQNIKDVFKQLHEREVISTSAFVAWREDTTKMTKDEQKRKTAALLKVNSWLESVEAQRRQAEMEANEDGTPAEGEEEEEEEDEYLQNPNKEFF